MKKYHRPNSLTRHQAEALGKALKLAKQGLPVFPCHSNKVPACKNGSKVASVNPEVIRQLWADYPGVLVGVPTGALSGLDVLDLNHACTEATLWLERNAGRLQALRKHVTREGGIHVVMKHKVGGPRSNLHLCKGVFVRSDGKYVIWWPSFNCPFTGPADIRDWPDWLLEACREIDCTDYNLPVIGRGVDC